MNLPAHTKPLDRPIDGALMVRNDGVHWTPTFGLLVDTLIRDLIREDPIDVEFTIRDAEDVETSYSARIVSYSASMRVAHTDDGVRVPVATMLAFAV